MGSVDIDEVTRALKSAAAGLPGEMRGNYLWLAQRLEATRQRSRKIVAESHVLVAQARSLLSGELDFEAWLRERAHVIRRADDGQPALSLIVSGADDFTDADRVHAVLDRVHQDRGVAALAFGHEVPATRAAQAWASAHGCNAVTLRPARLLRAGAHGVVAFGGPDDFLGRAHAAGLIVWRVPLAPDMKTPRSPREAIRGAG